MVLIYSFNIKKYNLNEKTDEQNRWHESYSLAYGLAYGNLFATSEEVYNSNEITDKNMTDEYMTYEQITNEQMT